MGIEGLILGSLVESWVLGLNLEVLNFRRLHMLIPLLIKVVWVGILPFGGHYFTK